MLKWQFYRTDSDWEPNAVNLPSQKQIFNATSLNIQIIEEEENGEIELEDDYYSNYWQPAAPKWASKPLKI